MSPTTTSNSSTPFSVTFASRVSDTSTSNRHDFPSFRDFAELIVANEPEVRPDKDGETVALVTFEPNSTRADAAVSRVFGIGADIEHVTPEQMAEIFGRIDDLEHLAYSTFNHTSGAPRFRIFVPTAVPLDPCEHARYMAHLDDRIGGFIDPKAKNVSRVFYTPATRSGGEPGWRIYHATRSDGSPARPLELPAAAPLSAPSSLPVAGRAFAPFSVADLRASLKRCDPRNRELLQRVIDGSSLGQPGERDEVLNRAASTLAFTFPEASPDALAAVFAPSLAVMAAEADDPANPAPTVADARKKIVRAQARAGAEKAKREGQRALERAALIAEARGGNPEPYSDAELAAFAAAQKVSVATFIKRRLIIQKGPAYWLFVDGRYRGPLDASSLMHDIEFSLSPAYRFVKLVRFTKKGEPRPKKLEQLMREHGSVAVRVTADLTLRDSYFDPVASTFYEAVCPVRKDLTPLFTPAIHEWMVLFGGAQAHKVLDWVATVTRLDRQSCAAYFEGRGGSGKTMLVEGLARLWGPRIQATELSRILDNFNEDLTRCPLISADEHIGGKRRSAEIRSLIGTSSRTLSRKHLPNATLVGSVRLALTANNDKLLGMNNEELSRDDIDALAERFLHVTVSEAPAQYLRRLGGRNATDAWVDGDLIARHALWLAANRHVIAGDRFLVTGDPTYMVRQLATRPATAASVTGWLAGYLANPAMIFNSSIERYVLAGRGEFLVNVQALASYWNTYQDKEPRPSTPDVANALANLSTGTTQRGPRGDRVTYRVIRLDYVIDWAERNGIGDVEAMRDWVSRPLPQPLAPPRTMGRAAYPGNSTSAGQPVTAQAQGLVPPSKPLSQRVAEARETTATALK